METWRRHSEEVERDDAQAYLRYNANPAQISQWNDSVHHRASAGENLAKYTGKVLGLTRLAYL